MSDTRDNLKSMLSESIGTTDNSVSAADSGGTVSAPESPHTFVIDKWGKRRAADLCADWEANKMDAIDTPIVADAHAALFDASPELAENPADKRRASWFQQLQETPEYRSLHAQTCLDPMLSGLAARSLCTQYVEYAKAEDKKPQPDNPGKQPGGNQDAPEGGEESVGDMVARIRSTGKALAAAKGEVESAKDTAAGLGLGGGGPMDSTGIAEAFKRVRNSEFLRNVMKLAGRMIRRAGTLQKSKVTAKRGEIVGIELGGDISRLIPRERLALASDDPMLRERAEYRLLRKRSLCYRQRVNMPVSAGPIIVSVDESGSMGGTRIETAKALALAMAWIAGMQKRWIALVGFSDGATGNPVVFPPGMIRQNDLIDWIEHFDGGGTTLTCPCQTMPDEYWQEFIRQGLQTGKTDHLIITDGCLNCPPALEVSYREFSEREQVKTYGIVIGGGSAGGLAQVCNRFWTLESLEMDSAAVEEMLSV
jgi:uncharacterized protein with von Willebrand factor type A (vWA) domain